MRRHAPILTIIAVSLVGSCREERRTRASTEPQAAAAQPSTSTAPNAGIQRETKDAAARMPEPPRDAGRSDVWIVDELGDCGPAAAAVATARGVAFINKRDEIEIARLAELPKQKSGPGRCAVRPLDAERGEFVALARSPAALDDHVYWVSRGRLVRRRIDPNAKVGPIEVLAEDARDGTSVAAPKSPEQKVTPATVAYIARPDDPGGALRAHLWVEGSGVKPLTEDGAAANTVALAWTRAGLIALYVEGRTGMSPVHARTIRFEGDEARLGEDVVVWLAGPSHPLTQIDAIRRKTGGAFGLMSVERDITRFGLSTIDVGWPPKANAEVRWRDFPNGLDPAPVSAAWLCGGPSVLYARPADTSVRASQELHLAQITEKGLGPSTLVARARAFSTASMASIRGGALLAYVADWRTWTRTVRCR